jgi:hypothetical protein
MRVIADQRDGQEAARFRGGERLIWSYLVCETGGASLKECRDAPGIPAVGTIPAGLPANAVVVYKVARPDPAGARVFVHIEDGRSDGLPYETFRATDSTGLQGSSTEVHPGTFEQLQVNLTDDSDGAKKTITVSYPIATRRIVLQGLFAERPPAAIQMLPNRVNGSPYLAYGRGFWKCTLGESEYSNRDGLYRVTVAIETTQEANWMSLHVARDDTGNHVEIPPAVLTTLRNNATSDNGYVYGIAYNSNGVLQVGMHPVANFAVLGETFG